jgi:hypothetical protein
VHLLEGARTRALLLDARDASRLAHHAALADEDDVTVGELLLELTSEAAQGIESAQRSIRKNRQTRDGPALDLVERLELGNGDEDDNRLLATLNVDLASSRDLEGTKLGLEVGNVGLEVEEGLRFDESARAARGGATQETYLSNKELGSIGSGAGRVGGASQLGGGGGRLEKMEDRSAPPSSFSASGFL